MSIKDWTMWDTTELCFGATMSLHSCITGDVVQATSTEGDSQSNGAVEKSVNVVKGHVRSIKLVVESATCVEVPADHDLLTWLVPYATSMLRRFVVGRDGKTAYERSVGRRAIPPLA